MKRKPPPGNVRRIVSLGKNMRGITTNKMGQIVQFESEQERKLILLLERDASVMDYVSQPETLIFTDAEGHRHKYTPDFKIWRMNGQIELHEVTVESRRCARESLRIREAAAEAICRQRGWRYLVHTDLTLPMGNEYANLDFLSAFRASEYVTTETASWWQAQLNHEPVHPQSVMLAAGTQINTGQYLNGLYHLLWHGYVQMDWQQLLIWRSHFHPQSRIWLATSPSRLRNPYWAEAQS